MPTDLVFEKDSEGKIITTKPTLWHCHGSRSLRPLWALEEMGIDYDVVSMQFPPRINEPNYKEMNVLGTVPYFIDGQQRMSESTGICHYLVERYNHAALKIDIDDAEYATSYFSLALVIMPSYSVSSFSTQSEIPCLFRASSTRDFVNDILRSNLFFFEFLQVFY